MFGPQGPRPGGGRTNIRSPARRCPWCRGFCAVKVCSSVHMTGGHGDIEPETAASGLLQRIDELELGTTGRFLHADCTFLPW